ncbi:MAG: hypothetical protein ACXW1U_13955 [Methylobacter sp.]
MSKKRRVTNLENKQQRAMTEVMSLADWEGLSMEQKEQDLKPWYLDIKPEEAERRYKELMS